MNRSGDCLDTNAAVSPSATEICNDHLDNDCDGTGNNCGLAGANFGTNAATKFTGVLGGDRAGYSVLTLDDFDGDGYGEAVVGAEAASVAGVPVGAVYLHSHPATGTVSLSSATLTITGLKNGDRVGDALYGPGDLDHDGLADLAIGATGDSTTNTDVGAVYLFYGQTTGGTLTTADADAAFYGEVRSAFAGNAIGGIVGFDGTSSNFLAIGDLKSDHGAPDGGAAFLNPLPAYGTTNLSSSYLAICVGYTCNYVGSDVATADLNGDGIGDFAVAANSLDEGGFNNNGGVYIVEGPLAGSYAASVAASCLWVGEASADRAGSRVGSPGDLDGDGNADLLVGAPDNDEAAVNAGAIYEIRHACSTTTSLASADGKILGETSFDSFGDALGTPVDTNGDGVPEYLVGASSGAVYGVYSGGGCSHSGTSAAGRAIASFSGDSTYDYAGISISGAADVNGDGAPDVLIGSDDDDEAGTNAGAAWLFNGGGM